MKVANKNMVDWLMPKNKTIRFELLNDIGNCLEKRGNPDQVIVKAYLQLSQCASVKAKRLTPEEISLILRKSGKTNLVTESRRLESNDSNDDVSVIFKYSGPKYKEDLCFSTKLINQPLHDDESSIEIRLSSDDSIANSPELLEDEIQVENKLEYLNEDKCFYANVTDVSVIDQGMQKLNVQKIQPILDKFIEEKSPKESKENLTHPLKDVVEKCIDRLEEVGQYVSHSSNNNEDNKEKIREIKSVPEQPTEELKTQINNFKINETNTGECKKKLIISQSKTVKDNDNFSKIGEEATHCGVVDKCECSIFNKQNNTEKTDVHNGVNHSFYIEDHNISPENHSSNGCNENVTSVKDKVKLGHKTDNVIKDIPTSANIHINKAQITKLQESLELNLKNKESRTSYKKIDCEFDNNKKVASNNTTISQNLSESKPLISVRKNLFNPQQDKGMLQNGFFTGNLMNSGMSANENAIKLSNVKKKLFTSSKNPKCSVGNNFVTESIVKGDSLKLQLNKDTGRESEIIMSTNIDDRNSLCCSNASKIIKLNMHDKIHNSFSSKEQEKVSNSKTNSNKLFSEHPVTNSLEADVQQFTSQAKYLDEHLTAKKRTTNLPIEIEKKSKMRRFSDDHIRPALTLHSSLNKNKIEHFSNLRRLSEQSVSPQIDLQPILNNSKHPTANFDLLSFEPEITLRSLLNTPNNQGTMSKQKEPGSTPINSIQNPLKNVTNEKDSHLKQLLQYEKNKMDKDKSDLEHCKQTISILSKQNHSENNTDIIITNKIQDNCQPNQLAHSSQTTPIREITTNSGLMKEVSPIVSDNTVSSSTVIDCQIDNSIQNRLQSNEMLQENQITQPFNLSEYHREHSAQNEYCTILYNHKEVFIDNAVDLSIDFFKFKMLDNKAKNTVPSKVLNSILQYLQVKTTNTQNITLHNAVRSYLDLYIKYIDESVSAKINKTAELLHLAIADWNRQKERKTHALRLTSELLRKKEINRADNDYKEILSLRGIKFREIFLSILSHFKDCEFVLLASIYFRISIALMNIDKENISYISSVRSLILRLLNKSPIMFNEACNRFLFLQNEEYNNTYKFVKQCLVSLCIVGCPLSEANDILKFAHTEPFSIQLEQMKSMWITKKQASAISQVQVVNGEKEIITLLTTQDETLLHLESSFVLNRGILQKARQPEQTRFQESMTSTKRNMPNQSSYSQHRSYNETGKLHALKRGLQQKILAQLPQHQSCTSSNPQQIIQAPQSERNFLASQTPLFQTSHKHLNQHDNTNDSEIDVTPQNVGIHTNYIVNKADQHQVYSQIFAVENNNNSTNPSKQVNEQFQDNRQHFFQTKEQPILDFGNTTINMTNQTDPSNLIHTFGKPVNILLPMEGRPIKHSLANIPCSTQRTDPAEIMAMNSLEVPKLVYCSSNCCSQLATLACGLCKTAFYCTRECQTKDWYSEHSRLCLGET